MTAEQIKVLEELGFVHYEPAIFGFYGYYMKSYGKYGDNGNVRFYDNGGFNIQCHSSVYEQIVADLAKLKEVGL